MKTIYSDEYSRIRELAGYNYVFQQLKKAIKDSERQKWLLLEVTLILHETAGNDSQPIRLIRLRTNFF